MATDVSSPIETKVVARILRGLAIDVETNPALAAQLIEALVGAGLLDDETAGELSGIHELPADDALPPGASISPSASIPPAALMSLQAARIDLLTLYRVGGAEQVRERLGVLDLSAIRRVIQVQELDLEKKTIKLRSVTKLIDFIIEKVGAQVDQERELAKTNSWML